VHIFTVFGRGLCWIYCIFVICDAEEEVVDVNIVFFRGRQVGHA